MSQSSLNDREKARLLVKSQAMKKRLPEHLIKGVFTPSRTAATNATRSDIRSPIAMKSGSINNINRVDNSASIDIRIYHENKKDKVVENVRTRTAMSPSRNPILQDNQEETVQFRPTVKKLPVSSNRMAINDETDGLFPITVKSKGVYNPIMRKPEDSAEKKRGIRTFHSRAESIDSQVENTPRRLRKENPIRSPSRNPILPAEDFGSLPPRIRTPAAVSSETQKLNDRKYLFAGDRKPSESRGKLFREQNFNIYRSYDSIPKPERLPERTMSPQEKKIRGSEMWSTITYEDAPPQRDFELTVKCTRVPMGMMFKDRQQPSVYFYRKTPAYT